MANVVRVQRRHMAWREDLHAKRQGQSEQGRVKGKGLHRKVNIKDLG